MRGLGAPDQGRDKATLARWRDGPQVRATHPPLSHFPTSHLCQQLEDWLAMVYSSCGHQGMAYGVVWGAEGCGGGHAGLRGCCGAWAGCEGQRASKARYLGEMGSRCSKGVRDLGETRGSFWALTGHAGQQCCSDGQAR